MERRCLKDRWEGQDDRMDRFLNILNGIEILPGLQYIHHLSDTAHLKSPTAIPLTPRLWFQNRTRG